MEKLLEILHRLADKPQNVMYALQELSDVLAMTPAASREWDELVYSNNDLEAENAELRRRLRALGGDDRIGEVEAA